MIRIVVPSSRIVRILATKKIGIMYAKQYHDEVVGPS